jgi:hypothetical protein
MATRRKMNWDGLADKLENAMKGRPSARAVDERFYQPKFDKEGQSQSIIRFLPSIDTDLPLVAIYEHKFRGPNGFYSELCPTTLGEDACPVCRKNRAMWDTDQNTVRTRSRKLKFISNVIIVNDPATPENNGKVFLYKYDKTTYKKIMSKIKPKKGGIEVPCNVFDYEEGANFKLIGKMKTANINGKNATFPDFSDSSFAEPTALKAAEIDAIEKQLFKLEGFYDKALFKSESELEANFLRVIGETKNSSVAFNNNAPATHTAEPDDEPVTTPASSAAVSELEVIDTDSDDDFIANLQRKKNNKK